MRRNTIDAFATGDTIVSGRIFKLSRNIAEEKFLPDFQIILNVSELLKIYGYYNKRVITRLLY